MPKKTARRIIDTKRNDGTTIITGVTVSGSPGSGASAAMAGDGLTYSSGVLNVGAGTLLTVGSDDIGITAGSTYQFVGTGAGTAAAWQNLSTLAGAGLTHSAGVLAVGAGSGITVNVDDVALTTPGTLTASTSNSASGNHTHAVTTGTASTLTVATTNATGSSASLARADHLHTITSSADVTGGGTSLLASAAGNLKLATGNIGSTLGYNGTFTSGFAGAGWRIDYGSTEAGKASATFDNLTIRGRMRVYELLIQQIRATNGSALISSTANTAQVVSTDDDPLWTVNGSQLTFNGANATLETTIYTLSTSSTWVAVGNVGNDTGHYHGFLTGDLIRAQRTAWDGSSFVGVVQSDLEVTGVSDLYTYQGARVSTASDAPAVGYDFVRIGSASNTSRRGVVYLTSDDDNAPFIDIVDGVASHAQWNTAGKIRARLGRLDGITDAQWGTLSGYGLWSDNVYLTGNIYATDGIFNGTVYATDGIFSGTVYASAGTFTGAITANSGSIAGFLTIGSSGGIYQGSGTAASPTTGLKIWATLDSGTYYGRIAGYNGGDVQWFNDTSGRMYVGYDSYGSTADGVDRYAVRLARDGVRFAGERNDSWVVSSSSAAIRWVYGTDGVDSTVPGVYGSQYVIGTNNASTSRLIMGMYNYVGSSLWSTRDSIVHLQAQAYTGSVYHSANMFLQQAKNGGLSSLWTDADELQLEGIIKLVEQGSAPSAPGSNYVYIYAVDNGSGKTKLMAKFASGAAQQIAIQP